MTRRRATAGLTLIEILIAVTLLSLLTLGMLLVMRVGLMSYNKATDKLMANRRVVGAQRLLESELMGLIPATPPCSGGPKELSELHFNFLEAEPQRLRIVSSFSLQEGWRGHPQILEFAVIPGQERGVRLIVNEIPYSPAAAGQFCTGVAPDASLGVSVPVFPAIQTGPKSFILADQLKSCSFSYFAGSGGPNDSVGWRSSASGRGWPRAIRVSMAPIEPDPSRLQPITVTAPLYLYRFLDVKYEDN
jgi:hypothetical protein